MAIDIIKAKSANPIKNGTAVSSCLSSGRYSADNDLVINRPSISEIESKYDNKFNDISYYNAIATINGGTYSGV